MRRTKQETRNWVCRESKRTYFVNLMKAGVMSQTLILGFLASISTFLLYSHPSFIMNSEKLSIGAVKLNHQHLANEQRFT